MEAWRWWAGLSGVAIGASVWAWVGLTLFRRDWARRVLPYARTPDVELCFGPLWLGLWRTARFAWRHPRTLRVGAIYGLHLLICGFRKLWPVRFRKFWPVPITT